MLSVTDFLSSRFKFLHLCHSFAVSALTLLHCVCICIEMGSVKAVPFPYYVYV